MKTILIMRHGEAEALQADDAGRALTSFGQQQAAKMGQWLSERFVPNALLVSPYVRAQQTAAAVKAQCHAFGFEQTSEDFIPSADSETAALYLQALIEQYPEHDTWLVVAHMPIVSYLVAQFCPDNMPLFPTCGVAHISFDEQSKKSTWQGLYCIDESS